MLIGRVIGTVALAFGLVGLVVCAAGGYAVWRAEARLQQANDRAFALVDRGLGAVEDRVRRVHDRVEQSRITTGEITDGLRDWATREAKDRVVARLEVEVRTEKLAGQLRAADVWLESSADSVRDVQKVLETARSLGAEVDPATLDEPLEALASVRGRVKEVEGAVAEVRELAAALGGTSDETRLARVLKLLARVVVTVAEITPRLDRLAARVADLRADAGRAKARTGNSIMWAAIGCGAVVAWVAAGQAALCAWGRNRWRRPARAATS